MKKILITNDDGITADGIIRLARVAAKLGEVTVMAPDHQCSAMSHRITLSEPIDVYPVPDFPVEGVRAYKSTGTPADCVRFGLLNFIEGKADLVLSGINYGYNAGSDIQYSGTAAAALEAASTGVHAIALSEGANGVHEVTDKYLEQVIVDLMEKPLGFNQIWNVNFPECKLSEFKGILENRTVSPTAFYTDSYREESLPEGGTRLFVDGEYRTEALEGTDFRACVDNYISVGIVNNIN